jgi:hypothetical protein
MSQSFERAKSRLDNIKTIQPLLSALKNNVDGRMANGQQEERLFRTV